MTERQPRPSKAKRRHAGRDLREIKEVAESSDPRNPKPDLARDRQPPPGKKGR